jgi:TonB family protein
MNNLIYILVQSSLSIAILYLIYFFFLRKDTFFRTNRFYLVSAMILSLIIPFVDLSAFLAAKEQLYTVLLEPVIITPEGILSSMEEYTSFYDIIFAIYLTGVFLFLLRFIYQLTQLSILVLRYGISRKSGMRIVFTDKNFSPFSFFNLIFLNRIDINSSETQKIIAHERVHIKQRHSIDLMLLEILTIIQWFNPFIWMYRHAIKTLHEYLADEGVLNSGVDVKVYSALLFSQSTGIQVNDLGNNFSKSLLKRRFIMMTKSKTQKFASLKLLFVLPLALSLLLVISFSPDVIAQQEKEVEVPPPPPKKVSATDQEIEAPPPPKEVKTIEMIETSQDEKPVFTVVEVMPEYPGGKKAMYAFLGENIKFPAEAKKKGTSGTVYVSFVVENDGSVTNVGILRGIGDGCDEEAVRVVKLMPNWKPGTQKGEAVRVAYNLPVKFVLAQNKEKEK